MSDPQAPQSDWRRFLDAWREDILVAMASQTRVPVKRAEEMGSADLSRALRANPIIGLGIGAIGAVAYAILSAFGLQPIPAALIAVGAMVLLTGARYEDGLSDVADGFGGGRTLERKLEIMRDRRVGTNGVIALVLSVLLRAAAIAAIADPGEVALALIAASAVSRGLIPVVMRMLEPVPSEAGAMPGAPAAEITVTAAALGIAAALICLGLPAGAASFVAAAGAVIVMAALAFRQVGGYTVDVIGACQQVGEIVMLLAAAAGADVL